jgi:hypothetical protein
MDYRISDQGLNLSDYRISDLEKTIGCPPLTVTLASHQRYLFSQLPSADAHTDLQTYHFNRLLWPALAVDVEGGRLPEEADEIVTLVPETQLTRRSWRCKFSPRPTKKK